MAIVSLSEAAKLVGKSKPTLWRAHKDGKLSMNRNSNGQWRVDTSELLRVYGQFSETPQEQNTNSSMSHQVTPDIAGLERENDSLKQHIVTLNESLKRADETLNDLRTRLDTSEQERRETQRLLTHQSSDKKRIPLWPIIGAITTITAFIVVVIYAIKNNLISL